MESLLSGILRDQCKVCRRCEKHILRPKFVLPYDRNENDDPNSSSCPICLGIQSDTFVTEVIGQIQKSFKPYGGLKGNSNMISKDAPTVSIPNHVTIRIHCILCALRNAVAEDTPDNDVDDVMNSMLRGGVSDIFTRIKDGMRNNLRMRVKEYSDGCIVDSLDHKNHSKTIQSMMQKEESGYMNCHVIIHASSSVLIPSNIMTLPISTKRRDRKRFRGNDPTDRQGGDPRTTLHKRTRAALASKLDDANNQFNESSKASLQASILEHNAIIHTIDTLGNKEHVKKRLGEWIVSHQKDNHLHGNENMLQINAAAWRQAFYLKGRYTKSKRTISQTPFFVPCDEKDKADGKIGMKKLGTTSVEEEICPVVASIACGGVSKQNNEPTKNDNRGATVFGMVKFHASGREDMDVRMILPEEAFDNEQSMIEATKSDKSQNKLGSGRPFVLEIIDALRVPNICDLEKTIHTINRVNQNSSIVTLGTTESNGEWVKEPNRNHVQYGYNPAGVGISGLNFCVSSSFKNLQSETEDKVKFYGCLCWSEKSIPDQVFLETLLLKGSQSKDELENGISNNGSIYPLEIKQATPLRVLHRRSAAVRIRHVLSLRPYRIDEHWFRLSLSTTAGTYVKEFCHGDCGRSFPSISSLLGCKTDIVELDCEGIAVS